MQHTPTFLYINVQNKRTFNVYKQILTLSWCTKSESLYIKSLGRNNFTSITAALWVRILFILWTFNSPCFGNIFSTCWNVGSFGMSSNSLELSSRRCRYCRGLIMYPFAIRSLSTSPTLYLLGNSSMTLPSGKFSLFAFVITKSPRIILSLLEYASWLRISSLRYSRWKRYRRLSLRDWK